MDDKRSQQAEEQAGLVVRDLNLSTPQRKRVLTLELDALPPLEAVARLMEVLLQRYQGRYSPVPTSASINIASSPRPLTPSPRCGRATVRPSGPTR